MSFSKYSLLVAGLVVGNTVMAQPPGAGSVQGQAAGAPTEVQAAGGYISEDAIELTYKRDVVVNQIGATELAGGVFFNEARDLIITATGLSRIGAADFRRFVIHGGARMYASFLHTEDDDVFSVAVGGSARYYFGQQAGSSIVLSAFYGPDILTFGSADGIRDVSLRFEIGLQSQTSVFVGYRVLEFDLVEDREVDDGLHIGARYRF